MATTTSASATAADPEMAGPATEPNLSAWIMACTGTEENWKELMSEPVVQRLYDVMQPYAARGVYVLDRVDLGGIHIVLKLTLCRELFQASPDQPGVFVLPPDLVAAGARYLSFATPGMWA